MHHRSHNFEQHGIPTYKHRIGRSQYAIRHCNINMRSSLRLQYYECYSFVSSKLPIL
jgi:hypothetical protein